VGPPLGADSIGDLNCTLDIPSKRAVATCALPMPVLHKHGIIQHRIKELGGVGTQGRHTVAINNINDLHKSVMMCAVAVLLQICHIVHSFSRRVVQIVCLEERTKQFVFDSQGAGAFERVVHGDEPTM
jgi:hypothetical protein